jgi:hypothetical protein
MSAFSFQDAAAPTTAVEIAAHRVSAATIASKRGRAIVTAHASETVPEGALVPSLTAANVTDRRALAGILNRVLDKVGRPKRVGLIVPDPIAKVSLLKFQQVPSRAHDLDQLIRWQVKKAAPFAIEDAQLTYAPASMSADGQEFLVTVARRDIVAEYESLCTDAGAHPGIVDLATFNVVNAVLASSRPAGDWLLVNVGADWASMVILRGADPILFRSRGADAEGTLADLVHQTSMYYEDRLSGTGFQRVLLAGLTAGGRQNRDAMSLPLAQALEDRLGAKVDSVDARAAVTFDERLLLSPAMVDSLAPLAGFLVRDQKAAA